MDRVGEVAVCAENMEPRLRYTTPSVDGRRTLAFTGLPDGGDPLNCGRRGFTEERGRDRRRHRAAGRSRLRNREKRLSCSRPAPLVIEGLRRALPRRRHSKYAGVLRGQDFCYATLALCDWCWALKPEALPPPPVVSPEKHRLSARAVPTRVPPEPPNFRAGPAHTIVDGAAMQQHNGDGSRPWD